MSRDEKSEWQEKERDGLKHVKMEEEMEGKREEDSKTGSF